MKDKLIGFCKKHKEFILYFLFGIVTTVASLGAWFLTVKIGVIFWNDGHGEPTWGLNVLGSTVQWVVGVLVAFVTNKKWVFVDAAKGFWVTIRQMLAFFSSRALTYVIEIFLNLGLVALFGIPEEGILTLTVFNLTVGVWIAKIVTTVVIVLLNYLFSKVLVFRKKSKKKDNK